MPEALLDRIQTMLPEMRVWQGYGMTECSSVLTLLTDRDHERAARSSGPPDKAVPGVNIRIQDKDGNVLGRGRER